MRTRGGVLSLPPANFGVGSYRRDYVFFLGSIMPQKNAIRSFVQELRAEPVAPERIGRINAFVSATRRSQLVTVAHLAINSEPSNVVLRWQTAGGEFSRTVRVRRADHQVDCANIVFEGWPGELQPLGFMAIRSRLPQFESFRQRLVVKTRRGDAMETPANVEPGRLAAATSQEGHQMWEKPAGSVTWATGHGPLVVLPGGRDDGPFLALVRTTWLDRPISEVVHVDSYDDEFDTWVGRGQNVRPEEVVDFAVEVLPLRQDQLHLLSNTPSEERPSAVTLFLASQELKAFACRQNGEDVHVDNIDATSLEDDFNIVILAIAKPEEGGQPPFDVAQRHDQGFEELWIHVGHKIEKQLSACCYPRFRNEVEELVQQTAVKTWRYLEKIQAIHATDGMAGVERYIRRIASSVFHNHVRTTRRLPQTVSGGVDDGEGNWLDNLAAVEQPCQVDFDLDLDIPKSLLKLLPASDAAFLDGERLGDTDQELAARFNWTTNQVRGKRTRVIQTVRLLHALHRLLRGSDVSTKSLLSEQHFQLLVRCRVQEEDLGTVAVDSGLSVSAARKALKEASRIADCAIAILHLYGQKLISEDEVDLAETWLIQSHVSPDFNAPAEQKHRLGRRIHGQHLLLRDGKHGPLYEPGRLFVEQFVFHDRSLELALEAAWSSASWGRITSMQREDLPDVVLAEWERVDTLVPNEFRRFALPATEMARVESPAFVAGSRAESPAG